MKTKTLLSTISFILISFFISGQNCVDFESLTSGTQYGDGINTIGEVIFTESNIPVSVEYFEFQTGGTFGTAWVDNALPDFGTGLIMWHSNINLKYDFSSLPYTPSMVLIEFGDWGGFENFSVNNEPIYVGDIVNAPNFPGVMVNIVQMPMSGGIKGYVILTGAINNVLIGGQEFMIDNVCAYAELSDCIDFEMLNLGEEFGNGINSIGDIIYTEDGVPVSVEYFEWQTGGTFGTATVDFTFDGFGFAKIMRTNNINLGFDFTQLGYPVHEVTFEFATLGGFENLSVNGSPIYVGELKLAPNPPGVVLTVNTWPMPGGEMGFAKIVGDIEHLVVGGQEFWLDHVCFYDYTGIWESNSGIQVDILEQNFPNPLTIHTIIPFSIEEASHVNLRIYNLIGQEIRLLTDEYYNTGEHSVQWDGKDHKGNSVPEGIYLYQIQTDEGMDLRKMMVVR